MKVQGQGQGRAPGAQGHETRIQTYRPFGDLIASARRAMLAKNRPGPISREDYANWCMQSGIHADTIGPVSRAASSLNWVLMFRSLREMAKEHAGSYDTLPKPMEIKVKCDDDSGLVCCTEAELKEAIESGSIARTYAETQKLKVVKRSVFCKGGESKEKSVLVNDRGQGFYSDMDLFAVLDLKNGDRIMMGSGREEHEPVAQVYRAKLDELINVLADRGTEFNMIQHGADYDWADRKSPPKDEPIAVFVPHGPMLIVNTVAAAEEFMFELQRQSREYMQ